MSTWEIVAAVLLPLLAIISALLGVKWSKGTRLLKEISEAVVALGLSGMAMHRVLNNPGATTEADRQAALASFATVAREFGEAIDAARAMFGRGA